MRLRGVDSATALSAARDDDRAGGMLVVVQVASGTVPNSLLALRLPASGQ